MLRRLFSIGSTSKKKFESTFGGAVYRDKPFARSLIRRAAEERDRAVATVHAMPILAAAGVHPDDPDNYSLEEFTTEATALVAYALSTNALAQSGQESLLPNDGTPLPEYAGAAAVFSMYCAFCITKYLQDEDVEVDVSKAAALAALKIVAFRMPADKVTFTELALRNFQDFLKNDSPAAEMMKKAIRSLSYAWVMCYSSSDRPTKETELVNATANCLRIFIAKTGQAPS